MVIFHVTSHFIEVGFFPFPNTIKQGMFISATTVCMYIAVKLFQRGNLHTYWSSTVPQGSG